MLDLSFADSKILYFWQVLESIHKFIIELHVLRCLFVKGSNKLQRSGRIISNFTKRQIFSSPSALGGNFTMRPPILHNPQKAFLSSSVWPRREYTRTLNQKESLLICFENLHGVRYSHRQNMNRMMNTLIIANINAFV